MEIHPPHRPIYTVQEFLIALATITMGVLIALSLEGLLEWNHYRVLVREARETIAREIADNKKDLDAGLADPGRVKNIDTALKFANDMLTAKKSDVNQINLVVNLAELTAAGWRSAERTGALSRMDFGEVQKFSRLYDFQELFTAQQRRALERLAVATAMLSGGDPHNSSSTDLEMFRQHVVALRGELVMEEKLGARLSELYAEALKH